MIAKQGCISLTFLVVSTGSGLMFPKCDTEFAVFWENSPRLGPRSLILAGNRAGGVGVGEGRIDTLLTSPG